MGLIALKCPNCGGDVTLDDSLTKGFCMYCGSAIVNESIIPKSVKIDRTDEITNLLKIVRLAAEEHNWQKMNSYLDKIMEMDMDISDIWYMKAVTEMNNQKVYNTCIEKAKQCGTQYGIIKEEDILKLYGFKVKISLEDGFTARNYSDVTIDIDGIENEPLSKGSSLEFGLLEGDHTITIEGHSAGSTTPRSIRNVFKFNIRNDKTITIRFKKLSFGYSIEEK